jgi:hypothetical protein
MRTLRQGDPLLFNLVVDVLFRMLQKVVGDGLIRGLGEDLVDGGVISLQYADDTILFVDNGLEKADSHKWILTYFEMMSRMRVNYHKSEIVPINLEQEEEVRNFACAFGCPIGCFPIICLGILLHHNKLRREDIQPLINKIIKRIAGWVGSYLTMLEN